MIDLESWLSQYSKIQVRSVQEGRALNTPTINKVIREASETKARAVLVYEISEIVKFLNVGKTMNKDQIAETVKMIILDYSQLTLADFRLFGDRYRRGRYGKSFDRLDGQTILIALEQYLEEKANEVESANHERHMNLKKALRLSEMHPDVIKAFKSAIVTPEPIEVNRELKNSQISESDDLGQKLHNDFMNLHKEHGLPGPVTMIEIDGQKMDFNQFAERELRYAKRS